jgi:hypothetical protein
MNIANPGIATGKILDNVMVRCWFLGVETIVEIPFLEYFRPISVA